MSRRTQVVLIDDIDGKVISEGGQTVAFSYNGVDYTIDLSDKNATKFDAALSPYIERAQRVGGRPNRGAAAQGADDPASIRQWAGQNGYKVSARGRVSREVRAAYHAAH
jgi:hypothetical protein